MDCGKDIVKMYESNYPENLRRVYIVNGELVMQPLSSDVTIYLIRFPAPRLFTLLFSIIKPFMHQATIDKVRIFGFNKSEWAPAILEEIDPDQLPEYYGGMLASPDGDPKCPHLVSFAISQNLSSSLNADFS